MTEADDDWPDSELAKTNPIVELPRLPPQNRSASGDIQAKVTEHELTEISTVRVLDERALKLPSVSDTPPAGEPPPTMPPTTEVPSAPARRGLVVVVLVVLGLAVAAALALR